MSLRGKSSGGELNGILDGGSHLTGELHFEQTFRIDGRVTGKIVSNGDLIVGERGEIDGEISVGRAYISGTVRGRIAAARRLEIAAGGRVRADVTTPVLVIAEGARFDGGCAMERPAEATAPAAAPAAGPSSATSPGPSDTARVVGRIASVKER